jgi:hypothetical protein
MGNVMRVTILIVCGVTGLVACAAPAGSGGTASNIWLKQTTNASGGGSGGTDGGGMGR